MTMIQPSPTGVAPEGIYEATIISATVVKGATQYTHGKPIPMLALVFRVQEPDGALRDIHERYPITSDVRSNMHLLWIALRIKPSQVIRQGVDTDTLKGKKLNIRVFYKTPKAKHANAKPLPPTPPRTKCAEDGCSNPPDPGSDKCCRHNGATV